MKPLRLFGLCFCLLMLAFPLPAHEDDPKLRDWEPPYRGPGYRAATGSRAGLPFDSSGLSLRAWLPLSDFGNDVVRGNDCWGYVSSSGREYAIFGHSRGTSFVEITNPDDPQIIETIIGPNSSWRDIKVFGNHAYAVSEGGEGIQIIDMTEIDQGTVVLVDSFIGQSSEKTHNVTINVDSGFLYRLGGSGNGLRIYSLANPIQPVHVADWSDRYVHDAQVVIFDRGPYAGREIVFACAGFNNGFGQTGLTILDVTDKSNIVELSHFEYPGGAYSHQGWLSYDSRYFYLNDEFDESDLQIPTTTHVLDITDLRQPTESGTFTTGRTAIDHNLYVREPLIFEANYRSGLWIFDATDPAKPQPLAFFDTYPDNDDARFNGLWSNYPYFPSETIIGSDLERGLFIWTLGDWLRLELDGSSGASRAGMPGGVTVHGKTTGYQAGSTILHYSLNQAPFQDNILNQRATSSGTTLSFDTQFPNVGIGDRIAYYFTVRNQTSHQFSLPITGMKDAFSFLFGDLNGDDAINLADIISWSRDWQECQQNCSGELNGDNRLEVLDAIVLVNAVTQP